MRKILIIALNGLTRVARDRRALIMLLLFPMILIAILGQALKGMMGGGDIKPFPVLVINADQAVMQPARFEFGKILVTDVLGSDGARKILDVTAADDLEKARQQVANGKAVALIYVPASFTADVIAGRPAKIEVAADPGQPLQSEIVAQIVQSFTDALVTNTLAVKELGPQALQAQSADAARQAQALLPKLVETSSGARKVTAIQYYAAAMAVMFMVMTALQRAKDIIRDRQEGTLARILTSPTGKLTVMFGQIVSSIVVIMAQFLVLMIGTRLIFGVDWGPWGAALLLGTAFALAGAGIGTAAAGMLKDPQAADALGGILGNIFAALSGGMFPIYFFGKGMKLAAHVIPNYWGLTGFLDQMAGLGLERVWLPVAVLAGMGLVTGSLGAWRLASK